MTRRSQEDSAANIRSRRSAWRLRERPCGRTSKPRSDSSTRYPSRLSRPWASC